MQYFISSLNNSTYLFHMYASYPPSRCNGCTMLVSPRHRRN